MRPVFIFSLPRSGSTLLQRILGSLDDVHTVSEPGLLLPLLYTLRDQGVYAEYGHKYASTAIIDFCKNLPGGQDEYLLAMRDFVLRLYARSTDTDVKYFLDKTPRYHLIIEEIINLFPDAKFIFLWRNPLSIVASIIDTWGKGMWNLYHYRIDLYNGLSNLISAYRKFHNSSFSLRYEDLIENPEDTIRSLLEYLQVPFDSRLISRLDSTFLEGRWGDTIGLTQYRDINKEPLEKWKAVIVNPVRKVWCRGYIKWIGSERLALMGYSLDELLAMLGELPLSMQNFGYDILLIVFGWVYIIFELQIIKDKIQSAANWHQIHKHS